eukprot:COSAG05_NODE_7704_length_777_cov_5.156342_1_plen_20_part_10
MLLRWGTRRAGAAGRRAAPG